MGELPDPVSPRDDYQPSVEDKCPHCEAPLMSLTAAGTGRRTRCCFVCCAAGKAAWP